MHLYMRRDHVYMRAKTACMIMLLEGLAAATPTLNIPFNSQFPPAARVSSPFSFTLSESTFSSDGILTYALSSAPSWLSLDSATRTLSGTPPDWASGTGPTMDIVATDGSGSVSMRSTLVVSPSTAPEVAIPSKAQFQSLGEGSADSSADDSITLNPSSQFCFSFSRSTFTYDGDPSALGIFAVTVDNTPLPPWISFDNSTMTFSGETPNSKVLKPQERFGIRLIASDTPGFAGASKPLYIVVENHKLEWDDTALQMKTFVGKPFEFNALSETLKLDGKVANRSDIISIATTKAPSWLEFDNNTYVLYGTPQEPRKGASPLDVTVSAQDRYGGTATVVIRVTLANNIFSDGDIAPVNASIGQPFSYNISQAFVDPSAVNIGVSVSPEAPWLSFDSKTLVLSGDVSSSAGVSSINIAMAATPKFALSKTAPDLKSFTINVVSQPLSTSSAIHTSAIIETEDSTIDSNGLEAIAAQSGDGSRRGLSRGELAAVVVLSIFAVILIAGILVYCGRRQRNRFKFPDPIVLPLSKRDISKPRLQKKFSILGLSGSPGSIHPGLRAKAKNVNKVTFDNPDTFSTKLPDAAVRPTTSSSKYSDQPPSQLDAGNRGHKDFSRPFQGAGDSENSIADDPDIIIIQNFPSEPDEETKAHGITSAPSAVRTKGGTHSFHPYRTAPRPSILQQTPEASRTTNTQTYRTHKRHRTPSNLGPLPNTPSKLHSSTGLKRTGSVRSERSTNRKVLPGSANGHNQGPSVSPVKDGTRENIPGSPLKSSSARPRSSLSFATESTDVLYLGQSSPTNTTDDTPSLKSSSVSPFGQPPKTFLDTVYTPSGTNTGNSSPSLTRLPSRRAAGSSPFFSGTHRTISRVQSRSKKLFGQGKEVAAMNSRRPAMPEPVVLRKLARDEKALQALRDPGLAHLLDGPGSSRNNDSAAAYTGSIEMTEDGTRRLMSFMAAVDKRKSWVSDADSRQSFSAWDFGQDNDGPSEVATGVLQRFKSYRSNVSGRSKTSFRGQSIWLGDKSKDAGETAIVEHIAALEYCGGLFKGSSNRGGLWTRSKWSESTAESPKRLPTPMSPKSFELGLWGERDGNDGIGSIVV